MIVSPKLLDSTYIDTCKFVHSLQIKPEKVYTAITPAMDATTEKLSHISYVVRVNKHVVHQSLHFALVVLA